MKRLPPTPPATDAPRANEGSASLMSLAFERIRGDILSCELQPAERLRIHALRERYAVGATAIREALSRLVTEGLVEAQEQRGFRVMPVSRDDLVDLTQTRVDIEGLALRKALARGDVEWESQLIAAFHRLSKATPPTPDDPLLRKAWVQTHRQFHEALLSACGSRWLMALCSLLYDKSDRYRQLAVGTGEGKARNTLAEHQALMEAALARDADTATRLLGEHFWETTQLILAPSGALGEGPPKRLRAARGDGTLRTGVR